MRCKIQSNVNWHKISQSFLNSLPRLKNVRKSCVLKVTLVISVSQTLLATDGAVVQVGHRHWWCSRCSRSVDFHSMLTDNLANSFLQLSSSCQKSSNDGFVLCCLMCFLPLPKFRFFSLKDIFENTLHLHLPLDSGKWPNRPSRARPCSLGASRTQIESSSFHNHMSCQSSSTPVLNQCAIIYMRRTCMYMLHIYIYIHILKFTIYPSIYFYITLDYLALHYNSLRCVMT